MATWQYDLHLVSKNEVAGRQITEDLFESLEGWKKDSVYNLILEVLTKEMKKAESWSDDLEIWGEEDKTCIQLLFQSDFLSEISVRVDLRSDNIKKTLNTIIELANKMDALIINENLDVIESSMSSLVSDIKKSDSFKFVKDPEVFLDNLEK